MGLWWIRGLSLAIAVALWFFLSWDKRERQSERVVEASVTYDTANDMVVMNPVRQIDVRVRGGSRRVRTLNPFLVNVLVTLPQTEPGTVDFGLAPEQVFVPEGVEVVSLDPNALHLTLDREISKRLPVIVDLVGEPAAGATVGEPMSNPPEVAVRGPQSRIEAVSVLKTRPVNLNGHAQSFREMASVLPPDPLTSLDPGLVEVRIPMQPPQLSSEALTSPRGNR
jgi:YbbR domain-containing protein